MEQNLIGTIMILVCVSLVLHTNRLLANTPTSSRNTLNKPLCGYKR